MTLSNPIRPASIGGGVSAAQLVAVGRELGDAKTVKELLTQACDLASAACGCEHALIVAVDGHVLTARATGALQDPIADRLRRRLLANPVALVPHCVEADVIRDTEAGRPNSAARKHSALGAALGWEHVIVAPLIPEQRVLAMLVLEQAPGEIDVLSHWENAQLFAVIVSAALESLLLRERLADVTAELRHLSESARALLSEASEAATSLPTDHGGHSMFTLSFPPAGEARNFRQMFTERERGILEGMAAGRTNQEIATDLQIATGTVKKYVARIMQKLGAATRGEAAVRYVRMTSSD